MKAATILLVLAGLMGLILACGGASEPSAATPEPAVQAPVSPADVPPAEPAPQAPEPSAVAGQPDTSRAAPADAAPTLDNAPPEAATAAPVEGQGPQRTVIHSEKSKKGAVNFEHWTHQNGTDKCGRCHHNGKKSCGAKGCHSRAEVNAPTKQAAYHGRCLSCHKKEKVYKGCDDCHAKS